MNEPSYDTINYESHAFRETHPQHLYALGTLCGLKPTPVEQASVLELGCASGGNLIPLAFHLPSTQFLGIDLSSIQIQHGLELIQDLALNNITLREQSILHFDTQKKFDYILCHGVFSWVDQPTRDKILAICHENLAENGIAFISYNTLPGWMAGSVLRDLMQWHTENIEEPSVKISEVRYLLRFIQTAVTRDHSGYGSLLERELQILARHPDSQLIHEHLSSYNVPYYFQQFMKEASQQQLAFLCEAFMENMSTTPWPEEFKTILLQMQNNVIIGQYLDFITNQRFRCTLLCHQHRASQGLLPEEKLQRYFVEWTNASSQAPRVAPKPIATLLARMQVLRSLTVTNWRHENIRLTPVAASILPYLDGSNGLTDLLQIVRRHLDAGELIIVDHNYQEITDEQTRDQHILAIIQDTLMLLAKKGLLQ